MMNGNKYMKALVKQHCRSGMNVSVIYNGFQFEGKVVTITADTPGNDCIHLISRDEEDGSGADYRYLIPLEGSAFILPLEVSKQQEKVDAEVESDKPKDNM